MPNFHKYLSLLKLVPDQVQSLRSIAETTRTITLQWDEIEGTATETYSITWSPKHGTGSVSDISDTSEMIDDLMSNTMYSFQVKALNDVGEGQSSDQYNTSTSKIIYIKLRFLYLSCWATGRRKTAQFDKFNR